MDSSSSMIRMVATSSERLLLFRARTEFLRVGTGASHAIVMRQPV
jgi:hypothetical protein